MTTEAAYCGSEIALTGICGPESKLVLRTVGEGDLDDPMAAFSSLPHAPGHERWPRVSTGPGANDPHVGQQLLLNPMLTCRARGVDPVRIPCARRDLNLCWSFMVGDLWPGRHVDIATTVPCGSTGLIAANRSLLLPLPRRRSQRGRGPGRPVRRLPPRRSPPSAATGRVGRGRAAVDGAGTLGLTTVAVLRALYPKVAVAVVARFPHQARHAAQSGVDNLVAHEPQGQIVEALATWSDRVLHEPVPVGVTPTRQNGAHG